MKEVSDWIQLLAKCPECGVVNHVITNSERPRPYHKYQNCGQLFPIDLYRVIAFTNDFNYPLF